MERNDIARMTITSVIVHDIPKHKKGETTSQVEYSERESDLTPELKVFFKNKVTEAISSKGFKVIFSTAPTSPVPEHLRSILKGRIATFIESSKVIAKHLHDIQSGWNPAGILVILKGKVDRKSIVVVMKLERDEGARLKKHQREHYIDIETVRDLMLTKKTKLYKVGFHFDREECATDFDGYVCDNQVSIESTSGIAKFFLDQFLGCELFEDPQKMTRAFFEGSKSYVLTIDDPIKRATYYEHLLSYMNRPQDAIDPREFATTHLEQVDRQQYEDHLTRLNVGIAPFVKDNELVRGHITRMLIDFENDVSIISRNGEFGNRVRLTDAGEGLTKAEITSKIRKIG